MSAAVKRKPYRLTAPVIPEHAIQKQVADLLRLEIAPAGKVSRHGVVWWSIDHANVGGDVPGIRVGRGIIAGIPDLFILYRGRARMIELKTAIGELSDAQRSVLAACVAGGGQVGIARTAEEVLDCLDEWEIPRARRVSEQRREGVGCLA